MTKYGRQTYEALKDNKLAPKKRFGQNFLVHQATAEAIVCAGNVSATDKILEVGVGLGALTVPLAAAAKQVIGYEIDSGIIRYHEEQGNLPTNVTLVHQDILTADFTQIADQFEGRLKILANLPYSISNPFIFKLIENAELIDTATIMLQKEVADRLMAEPRNKDYGVPTVLLASCATVKKLMTLKPAEFHPRPKVDSVVISIDFTKPRKPIEKDLTYNFNLFRQIVRCTFNQRRKTIVNTLSGATLFSDLIHNDKIEKDAIDKAQNKQLTLEAIQNASIDPKARPETLTVMDFIQLSLQIERSRRDLT